MGLLVGPHAQRVAGRVGEVETAAAGEFENGLGDDPAGISHGMEARLEIVAVENDQRLGGGGLTVALEAAVEPGIIGRGIGRAIIGEGPAKRLAVERFQRSEVGGGKFDIVDVVMVFCHRMSSQTAAGFSATSSISAIVRTL